MDRFKDVAAPLQLECGSPAGKVGGPVRSASFEIVVDDVVLPLVSGNEDVL